MQSKIRGLGFSYGPEKSRTLMPEERSHLKVCNRDRVSKATERGFSLLSSATSMVSIFPSGFCKWLLPAVVGTTPPWGAKAQGSRTLLKPFMFCNAFFCVWASSWKGTQVFFVGHVKVSRYLKNYYLKCHLLKPFASISPFPHRTTQETMVLQYMIKLFPSIFHSFFHDRNSQILSELF